MYLFMFIDCNIDITKAYSYEININKVLHKHNTYNALELD